MGGTGGRRPYGAARLGFAPWADGAARPRPRDVSGPPPGLLFGAVAPAGRAGSVTAAPGHTGRDAPRPGRVVLRPHPRGSRSRKEPVPERPGGTWSSS